MHNSHFSIFIKYILREHMLYKYKNVNTSIVLCIIKASHDVNTHKSINQALTKSFEWWFIFPHIARHAISKHSCCLIYFHFLIIKMKIIYIKQILALLFLHARNHLMGFTSRRHPRLTSDSRARSYLRNINAGIFRLKNRLAIIISED
jgi:hypothetical protein